MITGIQDRRARSCGRSSARASSSSATTTAAATTVRLQHCLGLAYGDGQLYIADTYNNKIKVCDPKTRAVKTLVGTHKAGDSDDPPQFYQPGGLSVAGSELYVADTNNHKIRVVDLKTQAVKTLALAGLSPPAPGPAAAELPQRDRRSTSPPAKVGPGKSIALDGLDPPAQGLQAQRGGAA